MSLLEQREFVGGLVGVASGGFMEWLRLWFGVLVGGLLVFLEHLFLFDLFGEAHRLFLGSFVFVEDALSGFLSEFFGFLGDFGLVNELLGVVFEELEVVLFFVLLPGLEDLLGPLLLDLLLFLELLLFTLPPLQVF